LPGGFGGSLHLSETREGLGPSALRRVKIQEKTKVGEYLVADSIEAVVSLAQMGIVEIHTWNSTMEHIERPNRIVWDLDPGPAVTGNRSSKRRSRPRHPQDAGTDIVGEDDGRAWAACRGTD
jgi:DNA primase